MTKYEALISHLHNIKGDCWMARFSEIEEILGAPLPKSARKYREWWANDAQNGRHWLSAGWRTEGVNFESEIVVFRKDSTPAKSKPVIQTKDAMFHAWDAPGRMTGGTCGKILAAKWKRNSLSDFNDKIVIDPSLLKNVKGVPHIASVEFVKALARQCAEEDMKKKSCPQRCGARL